MRPREEAFNDAYNAAAEMKRQTQLLICGLLVLSLNLGCRKRNEEGAPPVSPVVGPVRFQYAVYLLPGQRVDPTAALKQALSGSFKQLNKVDRIPDNPTAMVVAAELKTDVQKTYAPPGLRALKYFGEGLSPSQAEALQRSRSALILEFAHPTDFIWPALVQANELVEYLAKQSSGLIWDETTRQVFTPEAWHEKRIRSGSGGVPNAPSQITIHEYGSGEYIRAITLGMQKFGLPDLVVQQTQRSSGNQVGHFLDLLAQALVEGRGIGKGSSFKLEIRNIKNTAVRESNTADLKPNAQGSACLLLREATREDGDPDNRLIEISAQLYPGNDIQSKQDLLLSSFFGWQDSIRFIKHDQELLAASVKAKQDLPKLKQAFARGLSPGEYIQVKAPSRTPNGDNEWMWVEVVRWNSSTIKGTLENEPYNVPDLKAGQVVEIAEDEVFDYIHTFSDGHAVGNTTGEIIRKMSEAKDQSDSLREKPTLPTCEPN